MEKFALTAEQQIKITSFNMLEQWPLFLTADCFPNLQVRVSVISLSLRYTNLFADIEDEQ
jgi:hypothetical protein